MVIKMRQYEYDAVLYAKQYKNWDYQIIAKSAYLAGLSAITKKGLYEEIEVDFPEGTHQLIDDVRPPSETI